MNGISEQTGISFTQRIQESPTVLDLVSRLGPLSLSLYGRKCAHAWDISIVYVGIYMCML